MHITKVCVHNYKNFLDSGEIELSPGINLICGQNNAGKTALLEALSLTFNSNPHRSLKVPDFAYRKPEQMSWIQASVAFQGQDLEPVWSIRPTRFYLPFPEDPELAQQDLPKYVLARSGVANASIGYDSGDHLPGPGVVDWDLYPIKKDAGYIEFERSSDVGFARLGGAPQNPLVHPATHILRLQRENTYLFKAERYNVGICQTGAAKRLKPDATNLAEVLGNLNSNPVLFNDLRTCMTKIFPRVKGVSTEGIGQNNTQILIWNHDPGTRRRDLAIPLQQCGTGLGQVLAILYVVLTSDRPTTILIDEPQSFLHPGAARMLIDILKDFGQHQFIIATHSPTIVSTAAEATITLVQNRDGTGSVQRIYRTATDDLRTFLSEVGASLADVFGAEQILWVEGATEEACFPLIVERMTGRPLQGVAIKGVSDTGGFDGKRAARVFELYKRLCSTASLMPTALAFILDSELRTDQQKDDLGRLSGNKVEFLPARMFENYLLDPEAVASVMNGRENFRETPITTLEVATLFESAKLKTDVMTLDGANLLARAFSTLSENRCQYDKVRDGLALTKWIVEHAPERFAEIVAVVEGILLRTGIHS